MRQALEVNRIGRETAQARMMLYDVLTCKQHAKALGQEAARAMESLRVARSARVLVLNCCWPGVMRTLREILEARPAHGKETLHGHRRYEAGDDVGLCALLRSAYLPAMPAMHGGREADRRWVCQGEHPVFYRAGSRRRMSGYAAVFLRGRCRRGLYAAGRAGPVCIF